MRKIWLGFLGPFFVKRPGAPGFAPLRFAGVVAVVGDAFVLAVAAAFVAVAGLRTVAVEIAACVVVVAVAAFVAAVVAFL